MWIFFTNSHVDSSDIQRGVEKLELQSIYNATQYPIAVTLFLNLFNIRYYLKFTYQTQKKKLNKILLLHVCVSSTYKQNFLFLKHNIYWNIQNNFVGTVIFIILLACSINQINILNQLLRIMNAILGKFTLKIELQYLPIRSFSMSSH